MRAAEAARMGMFPRFTLSRCFRNLRAASGKNPSTLYVLLASNGAEDDAGEALISGAAVGEDGGTAASHSPDALVDAAQEQLEQFLQGAHQMTACALAAIDACSADVPQTVHFLELLVLRPNLVPKPDP